MENTEYIPTTTLFNEATINNTSQSIDLPNIIPTKTEAGPIELE